MSGYKEELNAFFCKSAKGYLHLPEKIESDILIQKAAPLQLQYYTD